MHSPNQSPNFRALEGDLLRAGLAPRQVRRTVTELHEHFEDLVDAGLADGADSFAARQSAAREMGDLRAVATAMRAQPQLRSWAYRYPLVAIVVYPLTYLALLPAVPVFAGVAHASTLVRWGACLILAGVVTASMFLLMQLSIALS